MYASGKTLFDYKTLEDELDQEAVVMLARLFFDDTEPLLPRLKKAYEDENLEEVRSIVHMIKGCCRSLGALPVEEFCEVLEGAAVSGDWSSIKVGITGLTPLYEKLSTEIRTYLKDKE